MNKCECIEWTVKKLQELDQAEKKCKTATEIHQIRTDAYHDSMEHYHSNGYLGHTAAELWERAVHQNALQKGLKLDPNPSPTYIG